MKTNKHLYFMAHAEVTASASKCTYFQVGAVIVKKDRIISHGYNGTPANFPEDCPDFFCGNPEEREAHHIFSEQTTIHAEMNALLWAAREGIAVDKATIYVTLQPCHNCVKSCIAAGIETIIYKNSYDRAQQYSQEFCQKAGVKLIALDSLID
ncbi:MAG: deoxycytidylate deaminase [Brevinemataceae bacterium]